MNTLILTLSYWVHLLSTVIWLGGLAVIVLIALPALRQQSLENNQWLMLQQRLAPWINASLVFLLITGFVQMTTNDNYGGFLVFDSLWAWAMMLKHVAYVGLAAVTIYLQWSLHPEMARVALLTEKRPKLAAAEQATLQAKEIRLLWINSGLAVLILLFTAMMTTA